MTQPELALAAGTDKGYIGRIETGKTNPGLDVLQRIAAALDVPVSRIADPAYYDGDSVQNDDWEAAVMASEMDEDNKQAIIRLGRVAHESFIRRKAAS